MFNKKFLIILLAVFIVAVGCVSAHEETNDTVVAYENSDIGEISSVDDGIVTADILSDGENHARIDVTNNDTTRWRISVLDDNGDYVREGTLSYMDETIDLRKNNIMSLNLYDYYDSFPGNVTFRYVGDYQVDDVTMYVGSLPDTIVAEDVVDEGTFSATLYDIYGNPVMEEVTFYIRGGNGYSETRWVDTDPGGFVSIDVVLSVGNYTVGIYNPSSGQTKYYWWNITREDESKVVVINALQDGGCLVASAVDNEGNYLTYGTFYFTSENYGTRAEYLSGMSDVRFSLYKFDVSSYPQNITIKFTNSQYLPANTSIFIDSLNDSIIASDVVDEDTFSAKFLDYNGNALAEQEVSFRVTSKDGYWNYLYAFTDIDGVASIHLALPIGNYSVYPENPLTGQYKDYCWNITQLDDDKNVTINAYQNGSDLIVSAVDKDGNNVTSGWFKFISEDDDYRNQALNGDPFVSFKLLRFNFDSYPQNITIIFDSNDFYSANTTFYVGSLNSTIDASDVVDEDTFSATFYDGFGNPLTEEEVYFRVFNNDWSFSESQYVTTDSNGVASLSFALMPDNYTVEISNDVTCQYMVCWWNITQKSQNKYSRINATQKGYGIVCSVLNETDGVLNDVYVKIYVNGTVYDAMYIEDAEAYYNIYRLGEGTYNITLVFDGNEYYYASNATLIVDVIDTIMVNSSFYNTTTCTLQILDYDGNPGANVPLGFSLQLPDGNYYYDAVTGEDGYLAFDFALKPGTYEIIVYNFKSFQEKTFSMEIIEEYADKNAEIHVFRDGYRFTVNVTDINGNLINEGTILVIGQDYGQESYEIINGSVKLSYFDLSWAEPEGDVNLTFVFENHNYYSANATSSFTVIDTIIRQYEQIGQIFNATFLDIDGKPLVNGEVNFFATYDYDDVIVVVNITMETDENGFAYIEIDDMNFMTQILLTNLVTSQTKWGFWINKKTPEITPVAELIDESTIYLPSGTETLVFEFSPGATGSVNAYFDVIHDDVYGEIDNGTFTINDLKDGIYSLSILYYGDFNFTDLSKHYTLIVGVLTTPVMTISEDIAADYLDDVNFTVNLKDGDNPISDASIEILIGNNTYNGVTDKDGNLVIPVALDAGNYDVSVFYKGNMTYAPVNKTTTFTVNKIDTKITVNESAIDHGDKLVVSVEGNATGQITVEIDGNKFNGTISDNVASIDLSALAKGTYDAVISYSGDNNYNNNSISSVITINPLTLNINASADPITAGKNAVVIVTGLENATGNVTVTVNGKTYMAPIVKGSAEITVPGLTENATAVVAYDGDDFYDGVSTTVDIVVNPKGNDTISIDAPDVSKYFGGPERFVVNVTDYQGNPIANKSVTIVINGREYTRNTDANGTASIALGLNSGVYNVTSTVDDQSVSSVVTILSTVNGTDVVKMYKNGTQYYATFLDSEGNYLADGTTVIFNINGVMYERKVSGDKGLARLNINLHQGEFVITAINTETGENTANNITVLPTLAENNDLTKYYRNASQYTVKVLGADGNPVGAGETVTFNINGVFYERQTNESGIATMNINLQPGSYVITADYNGCKVSNNITVLHVLNASDIKMKYLDGTQFVARLVDGQGNPYAKQGITFNINGVFYIRYTSSAGEAKLNINLMPGEYIITSSYNGANIANKITIES